MRPISRPVASRWVSAPGGSGQIYKWAPKIMTKDEMIQKAQDENTMITWVLRVGGFVLMAIGIYLIFAPLVVIADVLPILGDFLSAGITDATCPSTGLAVKSTAFHGFERFETGSKTAHSYSPLVARIENKVRLTRARYQSTKRRFAC